MSKVALVGGLVSIGEILAAAVSGLAPQISIPVICVTIGITVAINVTVQK